MALASQTSHQTDMARTNMAAASRFRRGPIIAAAGTVVALGALAGGWWLWTSREPKGAEAAQTPPIASSAPTTPAVQAAPPTPSGPGVGSAQATPPPPEPLSVIHMGAPKSRPGAQAVVPPTTTQPTPVAAVPASQPTLPGADGATLAQPGSSAAVSADSPLVTEAERLVASGKLVEARALLTLALTDRGTSETARAVARQRAGEINQKLLFSTTIYAGDPLVEPYAVQAGDSFRRIVANKNLAIDWRLIQRINGVDPKKLSVGQKLKLIKGPFHAIVTKSAYRLDLYVDVPPTSEGAGGRLFVRSFTVGLGENDSTPIGNFVVRPNSKLVNPAWVNPRTGEKFAADNPLNPIGEHWIGLDPADAASAKHTSYGLHGTIDPGSIGKQASMGCVRLPSDDIALLYELLVDKVSTVKIVP